MLKKAKKMLHNQGNSFIMVVVTLSFLAILTAALLVAIALCYRLKAMDINSRDNFYYLEQAMDEIYAGVGKDAMDKLNEAYESTLEVMVYYDTESKSYVTLSNEVANKMFKTTYMSLIKDTDYKEKSTAYDRLRSFLSNPADESDPYSKGIHLSIDNVDISTKSTDDNLTILNLKLWRTESYATNGIGQKGKKDSFTQTVTTDLVIGAPQYDVTFNTIDSSMNELFSFAMIADKGIEITNAKVNITGDLYAAADFYNKDYNGTSNKDIDSSVSGIKPVEVVTGEEGNTTETEESKAAKEKNLKDRYKTAVSSYGTSKGSVSTTSDSRYVSQNGTVEESMYSGLYMSNSEVVITGNEIIVPGSIAAMNSSKLTVSAISGNRVGKSDIWADSIVLGGYSMKKGKEKIQGSDVSLNARCYISDDLELNANNSSLTLIGEYYGYNNSSTDTRSFSESFLNTNGVFNNENWDSDKGTFQTGQAHYNSSSIILNGENTTLDMKDVTSMYIAGQSYIELSKKKKDKTVTVDQDGKVLSEKVAGNGNDESNAGEKENADPDTETIETKQYHYDKEKGDVTVLNVADGNNKTTNAEVQDYKTGEAVSIKSNQLAYIPPSALQSDGAGGYYVTLRSELIDSKVNIKVNGKTVTRTLRDFWMDPDEAEQNTKSALKNIPVIRTVVSGKEKFFFDFSTAKTPATMKGKMNEFIATYCALLQSGAAASNYLPNDITDYEDFKVDTLRLPVNVGTEDYSKIYSNAAITVKMGSTFNIVADSTTQSALENALRPVVDTINGNDSEKQSDSASESSGTANETISTVNFASQDSKVVAGKVTTELQKQYKEMKLLLTTSGSAQDVQIAHQIDESAITPINHYFKFSIFDSSDCLITDFAEENLEKSGYGLWTSSGDITIEPKKSKDLKGVVICKGDVKFDDKVKSFEGIIVTGSKVIVKHGMNFVANEEIVKSVLRVLEKNDDQVKYQQALKLFRSYGGDEDNNTYEPKNNAESTKSIAAIQFEDILEFKNWKKNVD